MIESESATFGTILRRHRLTASLSQEALAERAGLSANAIAALERGRRTSPRAETVALLAEAMALTPADRTAFIAAARGLPSSASLPDLRHEGLSTEASLPADEPGSPTTMGSELPSETLTFLFTDIEGSTPLWEHHEALMHAVIARHDALFDAIIINHGGRQIKERGEGDSIFAVFPLPAAAVAAALALQQALLAESWPVETPIRVRIGLHTGRTAWRAGGYYGPEVNRCARIRSLGSGGQVLLSAAIANLVLDNLPAGATIRSLGRYGLKGLQQPEEIYQLVHPDLPNEFPPLQSQHTPRQMLPEALTSFIGREREQTEILELLKSARLLTLTGPGGVGKTRLALAVATALQETYADGVVFVDLSVLRDPALVAATVARALGLRESGASRARDLVLAHLQSKHLLLVLDNFEQVVEAAPLVADLVASCPRLVIVVTSRTALRLRAEQRFRVPPLPTPSSEHQIPFEAVAGFAAVRLFVARARAVQRDFALIAENAQTIAQICQRLDGLPLAIELAAARVPLLPPAALLARLERSLAVLRGGARDLPARQQTLRATIDWSYSLLTGEEQALFRRLGTFEGGATLEAIETICDPDGESDVLEGMTSLAEKSLLVHIDGDDAPRFALLETLREYAREQLEAQGETARLRQAHAAYYLALAEADSAAVRTGQKAWLEHWEREHDNVRAMLRWARERSDSVLGLRISAALWRLWYIHGHLSEGRTWLEGLLTRTGGEPALRARALFGAGVLAVSQSDYESARVLCEECLSLYQQLGDKQGVAVSLNILGNVAIKQSDTARAVALSEESLALHRELADRRGIAMALNNLGTVLLSLKEYGRAEEHFVESLALNRELEDTRGVAVALINLGIVARRQHDYPRARTLCEESLALARGLGDKWGLGAALRTLGEVARDQGEYARAAALYEECLSLQRELGDKSGIARVLHDLGGLALDQQHHEQAVAFFSEGLALYRAANDREGLALCLEGLAKLAAAHGRQERVAWLGGAAAALQGSRHVVPLSAGSLPTGSTMEAARRVLGDAAFAAAWAAGYTAPLERALDEALAVVTEQRIEQVVG